MVWIPSYGRNLQLAELRGLWVPAYEQVFSILGSTGIIIPIGDHKPDATTVAMRGEIQTNFTYSEAIDGFDTAFNLVNPASYQGIIPIVTFNGSDEEADTPDAAYWTRGDGAADSVFSIGAWLNPDAFTGAMTIFSKWAGGAHEWLLNVLVTTGKVRLRCWDESAGGWIDRATNTALVIGQWHFVAITYDATESGAGMIAYYDGASDQGSTQDSTYTAMENTTTVTAIGVQDGASEYYDGKMAGGPLGPFFTQATLTADQILRLYQLGRRLLNV